MKRIVLLVLLSLFLLSGCKKEPPQSLPAPQPQNPSPPAEEIVDDGPLYLEELAVELQREGRGAQELALAVRDLPEALRAALAEQEIFAEKVSVTIGASVSATAQALKDGGVDLAFFPAEEFAALERPPQLLLLAGAQDAAPGEDAAAWNGDLSDAPQVVGETMLLCAAPTEYGKNLAARKAPTWNEISRARWGVLGEDSLVGRQAVELYLADHYEGDTTADLAHVAVYESFEALLQAAAQGEIDLLPLTAAERQRAAADWEQERSASLWEEVPVLGVSSRLYTAAAAVSQAEKSLSSASFAKRLCAAVEQLQKTEFGPFFGEHPYALAENAMLDPQRRLVTLYGH